MRRARWHLALGFTLAFLTASLPGRSQPAAHPMSRAEAAARFEEGTKAFDAGDFRRAAAAFEAANRMAPNTETLWNAARAWQRAGEAARAATLYSRYLRDAPPGAADRSAATAQLAALSPKLARIEVHGEDIADLAVDDVPCEDRVFYVNRGAHVVTATVRDARLRKDPQVEAGDVVSVVFEGPAPTPAPVASPPPLATPPAPPPRAPERASSSHKGWSPWVFASGAILTGVAVGLTIASGVDTDNALTTFKTQSTPDHLSSGQAKQLRTNILLGASLGLGAMTGVTGIWLTDWHVGGEHIQVGVGPARGAVRWTF